MAADSSLVTGSVKTEPEPPVDDDLAADRRAMGAAVVALAAGPPGAAMPEWTSPETGSRGVITRLEDEEDADGTPLCRRFTTTRASYDGVGLYRGSVCRGGDGTWRIRDLESL